MSLHQLFEEKADRNAFLQGFEMWCDRTGESLASYRAPDKEPVYVPLGSMPQVEETDVFGPTYRAIQRVKQPSQRPDGPETRVTEILNRAAKGLDAQQKNIQKHYGYERYAFNHNAAAQIELLPAIQQATLYEYADTVRELLGNSGTVVSIDGARDKRAGSQQQQAGAPAAQMG